MRSTEKLLAQVDQALDHLAAEPGSRILVGCSGGPDSTALLLALHEVGPRRGLGVVAAHIDHGIRTAAERDAERAAVERLCCGLGVALTTMAAEPGLLESRARRSHRSLEETARVYRMGCLRAAARAHGCAAIALGHTADDQVETMIMRFFQGSSARGLAGIQPRAGDVIRPLLDCPRAEVVRFLAARGQSTRIDSSNDDRRFLRNRIRADLMPVARRVFPGHRVALRSLSRKMSALAAFVEAELELRDVWRAEGPRRFSAGADELFALPLALRTESLYRVLDRVTAVRNRLPYRAIRGLLESRPAHLEGGVSFAGARISLEAGRFLVGPHIVCPDKTGYFTLVAGPGTSHAGSYRLRLRGKVAQPGRRSRSVGIEGPGVRPPVIVRSRRRGDRLHTAAGAKSLKKLLNQWGVPLDARDDAAVVADSLGVVAVIALPWGAVAADREGLPGGGSISLTSIHGRRS